MNYEPLQSHDFHDLVWQPPAPERFVSYDCRDESWMRPLGLGSVVKVKRALYDVRDERNELIGYTTHQPSHERPYMGLPFSSVEEPSYWTGDDERPCVQTEMINLRTGYSGVGDKRFVFWQANLSDAPKLIRGRFIQTLGEDNIRSFARRIEMESRKRAYDYFGYSAVNQPSH